MRYLRKTAFEADLNYETNLQLKLSEDIKVSSSYCIYYKGMKLDIFIIYL